MALGMAAGIGDGALLGVGVFDNLAVGMAAGIAVGAAIGAATSTSGK